MTTGLKRWTALFMASALAVLLAGCGQKGDDSSAPSAVSISQAAVSSLAEPVSEPEDEPKEPEAPRLAGAGVNPLSGEEAPEGMLEGQRPVAVMVRNNQRALPQRGLKEADVIIEMPVEDGSTNLMALYADMRSLPNVGPVAPMQDQFLQLALPLKAIPAYINASQYAKNLAAVMDYKTIDGIYLGTTSFWFDYPRTLPKPGGHLHEYSWYTNAEQLWAGMEQLDITTTSEVPSLFTFSAEKLEPQTASGEEVWAIELKYTGEARMDFDYNTDNGKYYDKINGEYRRGDDDQRTSYNNVFILRCAMETKEDSQLLDYSLEGGEGWYFYMGRHTPVKWQKGGPSDMLRIYDEDGQEIVAGMGKTYIGFLPEDEDAEVSWRSRDEVEEDE